MQNSYYPNNTQAYVPNQGTNPTSNGYIQNSDNYKLSFAEEILKSNIGRNATIYMSFPDSIEWRDKTFQGTILENGRDYILIKENISNKIYLLWSIYINYVEFEDNINF